MNVLSISGWAQRGEALASVLPDGARQVEYGDCASAETVLRRIHEADAAPDVLVGWSLGGQLAVRAVAAGVVKPKKLVLLGAPFQMVADAEFKGGVRKVVVAASRMALAANAALMLREFQGVMIARGDSEGEAIRQVAARYLAPVEGMEWLFWFDELAHFSCRHVDFAGFPPTHIIHGAEDAVIPFANAEAFAERIAGSTLHRLEKCGHAPHWHDANFVRTAITSP